MSATTNLKAKSRKNLDHKKEPQRLLPPATSATIKPQARTNSQPVWRKTPPRRHQPTPRLQAATPVSAGVARGVPGAFSGRRKKLFRACMHTWRKFRRELHPAVRHRRRGRFTLRFCARRAGLRHAILSARLKVLSFPRKRPTRIIRARSSFLRRQFSARASRLGRYVFRPDNLSRRRRAQLRALSRTRVVGSRRTKRSVRCKQLLTALPPVRRTRKLLYRLVSTFAKLVRSVLPAARMRKHRATFGQGLRGKFYASRRKYVGLQYSRLYSRYVARGGTKLRRQLIRRLRAKRLPTKAPARLTLKRRTRSLALRAVRLRRLNLRVKQAVQLQHTRNSYSPTPQRSRLWLGKTPVVGKRLRRVLLGLARRVPLRRWRRLSRAAQRPLAVRQYLRSEAFARAIVSFRRRLHHIRKLAAQGNYAAKYSLRKLVLFSNKLRRRQHFSSVVLDPVTYISDAPSPAFARYVVRFLARGSRRKRRLVRARVRAKRLRFARENAASMLFARLQPYYHSRNLGNRADCLVKRKSLRELDAAIALQQAAFAAGRKLTSVRPTISRNRQSLRVPPLKAKRLRALFRFYTGLRLSQVGRKRAPRFSLAHRTTLAYARRAGRSLRRSGVAVSYQVYYQQRCLRLSRREFPASLFKSAASGKLNPRTYHQLAKRWRRLKAVARAASIRTRCLKDRAAGKILNWKAKPIRRWRNPRYKGKWRNFRQPAWLLARNKQPPRYVELRIPNVVSPLPILHRASSRFAWLLTKKPVAASTRSSAKRPMRVVAPVALSLKRRSVAAAVKNKPSFLGGVEASYAALASKITAAPRKQPPAGLFASVFHAANSAPRVQATARTSKSPVRGVKDKPTSPNGVSTTSAATSAKAAVSPSPVRKPTTSAPKPRKGARP